MKAPKFSVIQAQKRYKHNCNQTRSPKTIYDWANQTTEDLIKLEKPDQKKIVVNFFWKLICVFAEHIYKGSALQSLGNATVLIRTNDPDY